MKRALALVSAVALTACGAAEQPEWIETVHAVGIKTSSPVDRRDLVATLEKVAREQGHHVDASTDAELEYVGAVHRQTINACAWKGRDDDETLACAMDFEDLPGLVYLTFNKGSEPKTNDAFREAALAALEVRFGPLPTIPIMSSGSLPLAQDLVLEDGHYTVDEHALDRYELDPSNMARQ